MNRYAARTPRASRRFAPVGDEYEADPLGYGSIDDDAARQVSMLEQSVRENAHAGAHYHGHRGGGGSHKRMHSSARPYDYRRHHPHYRRHHYSGAPFPQDGDDFSDEEEGVAFAGDPLAMAGEPFYEEEGEADEFEAAPEAAEQAGEIPMKWSTVRIPISEEVTMREGARLNQFVIPLRFNKALKAVAASGAYLGDVRIEGLRHNGPATLAARVESEPGASGRSDITLKAPKENPPHVDASVHATLSKSRNGSDERQSFDVRTAGAVYDTWLSKFPDHSVKTLSEGITAVRGTPNVALSVDHPIAQYLHAAGSIDLDEMGSDDTALVPADLASQARAEIEDEEANNHSFADAERLRLVLVRAHGAPTPAGAPAMNDPKEIVDGYIKKKRTAEDVKSRLELPVAIEGKWVLSYGHPLTPEEHEELLTTGTLAEQDVDGDISVTGLAPDALGE